MILKKLSIPVLLLIVIISTGCSSSVDTSQFNADGYYKYAMDLYNDGDYEEALLQFQNIILQYPGSSIYDDTQYYLGMTYFKREQYLLGAYEFSKLIRNIPASPYVPDSQLMLAECYYELSPAYPLDQTYTKKAIDEFQAFIDFFPSNPKVEQAEKKIDELNNKLAEKDYHSAVIYERMEYDEAAIRYYGQVAETYHDTQYAPLALFNKINLEIKKKMNSEAYSDISTFLSRYPNDTNAPAVQKLESGMTSAQ